MSNSLIEITAIEIKELAVIEPKQASEKFELIAKTMSDDQLAEVIENIDIVTLTQINGQHDISFPSIISELMTRSGSATSSASSRSIGKRRSRTTPTSCNSTPSTSSTT